MEENYTESYLPLMRRMTEVIAHDIRNPLNNILLSTAQFKLDTLPDQEDTAFYIDIIERNCDRVNEVLTDIIGVLYAPALDIKSGDMMELLHTLVAEYADKFEQRQINCT